MKDEIEKAMKALIARASTEVVDAGDALKLTQAALNLAHVQSVIKNTEMAK